MAATVRFAVLSSLWNLPLVRTPKLDSAEYLSWALRLAAGDSAWPIVAQHGPGYPYFLAALLVVGDGSIKFALAAQALVGAGTAACVAAIARRLYGIRSGWLAGVVYAIYGPVVMVETSLLAEGLLVFLLAVAILCLTGARGFSRAEAGGFRAERRREASAERPWRAARSVRQSSCVRPRCSSPPRAQSGCCADGGGRAMPAGALLRFERRQRYAW